MPHSATDLRTREIEKQGRLTDYWNNRVNLPNYFFFDFLAAFLAAFFAAFFLATVTSSKEMGEGSPTSQVRQLKNTAVLPSCPKMLKTLHRKQKPTSYRCCNCGFRGAHLCNSVTEH